MSDKTREALRKITVELAALVIDPDAERPDWMPCLMNGNSADAECLQNAYDAANDALAALSGEPEREAVGYVVIASQPVYRNKWLATTTVFDDKVVAENTAEHFNSDTPSYAIPIQYHVEPVGHAPAESERAKAHRTRWSTLAVEVGLLVLSKDESVRRMGEIMVSTMAGIEDTIPVAPAEPESGEALRKGRETCSVYGCDQPFLHDGPCTGLMLGAQMTTTREIVRTMVNLCEMGYGNLAAKEGRKVLRALTSTETPEETDDG